MLTWHPLWAVAGINLKCLGNIGAVMDLYIESIEGGTYLVKKVSGDHSQIIKNNNDKPLTFNSLEEIRSYFAETPLEHVWLTQSTPYEEMVGLESNGESMKIELDWKPVSH